MLSVLVFWLSDYCDTLVAGESGNLICIGDSQHVQAHM